jgi:Protein of unknown function (DUF3237)
MRLEPLYRATWTTPEAWSVEFEGANGTEGRSFFIAEGRSQGRLSARFRAANYPRLRTDGTLTPDFRGVLETDDGATILFSWQGYARVGSDGMRELLGSMTHVTNDERYRWLNDRMCCIVGEVRPREGGDGFDVVVDVAELVWEPTT